MGFWTPWATKKIVWAKTKSKDRARAGSGWLWLALDNSAWLALDGSGWVWLAGWHWLPLAGSGMLPVTRRLWLWLSPPLLPSPPLTPYMCVYFALFSPLLQMYQKALCTKCSKKASGRQIEKDMSCKAVTTNCKTLRRKLGIPL